MGFFAEAGPLQIFVSKHVCPQKIRGIAEKAKERESEGGRAKERESEGAGERRSGREKESEGERGRAKESGSEREGERTRRNKRDKIKRESKS